VDKVTKRHVEKGTSLRRVEMMEKQKRKRWRKRENRRNGREFEMWEENWDTFEDEER